MMSTAKRVSLLLVPFALLALTACGGDDDDDSTAETTAVETTEAEEPIARSTDAATTTEASTTTEAPTTTAAPTTTTDPVPVEVQNAYVAAGQPKLTADEYEDYTAICESLRSDPLYQQQYWAAERTDEDRAQILTNTRPLCPDVEAVLTAAKPVPSISSGTYVAGAEFAPGLYRASRYWALLDPAQEIIDNDLIDEGTGYSLMNVPPAGVAFVKIDGKAISTNDMPFYDPIAEGATAGTYLVGFDIQPGTYRVSDPDSAYAARLSLTPEGQLDIIDNDLSEGNVILTIQEGDFAFTYSGTLERIG